jgi:predicted RNA-binding protein with RPS1 domain
MKNRIKAHRKIKVRDLVPHELNPRVHTEDQREALRGLIDEIGYARSVLAYEIKCPQCHGQGTIKQSDDSKCSCTPCAMTGKRLKLIDGHLRQSELNPDDEIDVEVLDVNDEEARKLLLSIDPLAAIADYDQQALNTLRDVATTENPTLKALWANLTTADEQAKRKLKRTAQEKEPQPPTENYLVLIECDNEQHQLVVLREAKAAGHRCKALTS